MQGAARSPRRPAMSEAGATMRAVRYIGPGRNFELREVAIPEPGPGQVRVRIAACGVCRTELHLRDGLLDLGRRDFTVGHEIAGIIDALGAGVDERRLGQRVVAYVVCADAVTPEALDAHCLASPTLARFKRPRDYRFVDALPKSASGKLLRRMLRTTGGTE